MKFITRTLLLLLLITPLFAHADQTSKTAKAEEIMQLTHVDQLMGRMTNQMAERMKASAAQQASNMRFTPEQRNIYDDYQAKVTKLIFDSINWEKLKPIMVQVYTETYTDQELDGILAFYRSPVGQAMIAKQPELMSKSMNLMRQNMSTLQPQIEQLTKDFQAQMAKTKTAPASK